MKLNKRQQLLSRNILSNYYIISNEPIFFKYIFIIYLKSNNGYWEKCEILNGKEFFVLNSKGAIVNKRKK